MKTIVVGFSKNNSLLSRIIRFCSGKNVNVSHAFSVHELPDLSKGLMISHAQGMNVHYVYSKTFLKKNEIVEVYSVPVPYEQYLIAERLRFTFAGLPYAFRQLFGYLWVVAIARFKKFNSHIILKNPLADGDRSVVCTEYVMRQLGIAGQEEWTPEQLRQWCAMHGKQLDVKKMIDTGKLV